jgi:hypothetical protein
MGPKCVRLESGEFEIQFFAESLLPLILACAYSKYVGFTVRPLAGPRWNMAFLLAAGIRPLCP